MRVTVRLVVPTFSTALDVAALNWMTPPRSLSVIVSVAVLGVPKVAPIVGFDSASSTVSGPSTIVSLAICTGKVWLVCPALKVSVPVPPSV